ncbi:MAG: FAD-dependent monooxygenase [Rhizobiaceae bacterium]
MSQTDNKLPILISGAGIAGLTAALCLASKGFQVEIYEREEKLDPIGAGIQISPNAFRVLEDIGLGDELSSSGMFPDAIKVHDGTKGHLVTSIPLGQVIRKKFGSPYCVIHRADLQSILLDRCLSNSLIKIHFGSEVSDFRTDGASINADISSKNGKVQIEGSVLVAADGIWSKLRTNALQLPAPKYSGKIAWRAMLPVSDVENTELMRNTHLWLAPRSHIVTYPVTNGQFLNLIVITDEPNFESLPVSAECHGNFQRKLSGTCKELSTLFDLVTEWSAWPIFQTPPPLRMDFGRVAIIGDAAHAALPFAAQGAAMAIEDAVILAHYLAKQPAVDGMKMFEQSRIGRIQRVLKLSETNGRIYHMQSPLSALRNTVMKLMPGEMLLGRQAWIYDWRAEN